MKKLINFFFDDGIFEEILKNKLKYKVLNELVLSKRYRICVSNKEIEKIFGFKNSKNVLIKNSVIHLENKVICSQDWQKKLNDDKNDFLDQHNTSIFILNVQRKETIALRKELGFAVFSFLNELEEISIFLTKSFKISIPRNENVSMEKLTNPFQIFNSMVISDPYIFTHKNSVSNFKNFISIIIQKFKSLIIESQITIFTFFSETDDIEEKKEQINIFIEDLKNEAKISDLKIQFIIPKEKFHKRVLITNYTYSWTDKGFSNIGNGQKNDFHVYCRNGSNNLTEKENTYTEFAITDILELKRIQNKSNEDNKLQTIGDQFDNRLFKFIL